MYVFTVAVTYTDRTHWDGVQYAAVLADTETEATLVAAQLVGCRAGAFFDGMVTGTTVLEVMEA